MYILHLVLKTDILHAFLPLTINSQKQSGFFGPPCTTTENLHQQLTTVHTQYATAEWFKWLKMAKNPKQTDES